MTGDDGRPPWEFSDEEKEQVLSALDRSPVGDDETCGCGHLRRLRHPDDGPCTGTGAELDPEYQIPVDQACACEGFTPVDDGPLFDEVSWRDEAERATPEYYGLCTPDSLDDMALDAENRYPQGYR